VKERTEEVLSRLGEAASGSMSTRKTASADKMRVCTRPLSSEIEGREAKNESSAWQERAA
jgi:hypothetical protein